MTSNADAHPGRTAGRATVEDPEEELRERYRELLEELRTIIPGVQVLFAFLLTAPFSSRFEALDDLGTQVFAIALTSAGLAVAVLLTPAAYHRVTPRKERRERLEFGIRLLIIGMLLLALAIATSVFVVGRLIFVGESAPPADVVSPTTIGFAIAALIAGVAVILWFMVPLLRHRRSVTH